MANNKPIIVPWDFSILSEYALQHATIISKRIDADIVLAHIVKSKKEISEATVKFETLTVELGKKFGVKPDFVIRDGSIFEAISAIIEEQDASFAVMGTHGIKGMQKFTGSWALKVIIGSKAPFIVVQEPPRTQEIFKEIAFPVGFEHTDKEKLIWASFMSKFTKATFHLCYLNYSDEVMRKKAQTNVIFAQKYLQDKEIDFKVVKLEGKNLADETLAYSNNAKVDLLLVSTTKNIRFQDYLLGADEQKIIANPSKFPVMVVNPRTDLTKVGGIN